MTKQVVPIDIRLLSLEQLETAITELGERSFRAKQIYEWLWKKGAKSFDEMTSLSKSLRTTLGTNFMIRPIEIDAVQKSVDGTLKTRFRLHDGHLMESVLIPVP